MKRSSFLAAILAMCCCGGCWLMQAPENRPAENYDLAPAQPGEKTVCRFSRIRNLSPAGRKMLYRQPDNRMTESTASWVQTPEALLQRALESRILPGDGPPEIRSTLLRFELDLAAEQAFLVLDLQKAETVRRLEFAAPLADRSGSAAARAMSECVDKLANSIRTMIQEK